MAEQVEAFTLEETQAMLAAIRALHRAEPMMEFKQSEHAVALRSAATKLAAILGLPTEDAWRPAPKS